nr:proline-rich protein 36-like [Aegilops tauschii subsp. strangulata]
MDLTVKLMLLEESLPDSSSESESEIMDVEEDEVMSMVAEWITSTNVKTSLKPWPRLAVDPDLPRRPASSPPSSPSTTPTPAAPVPTNHSEPPFLLSPRSPQLTRALARGLALLLLPVTSASRTSPCAPQTRPARAAHLHAAVLRVPRAPLVAASHPLCSPRRRPRSSHPCAHPQSCPTTASRRPPTAPRQHPRDNGGRPRLRRPVPLPPQRPAAAARPLAAGARAREPRGSALLHPPPPHRHRSGSTSPAVAVALSPLLSLAQACLKPWPRLAVDPDLPRRPASSLPSSPSTTPTPTAPVPTNHSEPPSSFPHGHRSSRARTPALARGLALVLLPVTSASRTSPCAPQTRPARAAHLHAAVLRGLRAPCPSRCCLAPPSAPRADVRARRTPVRIPSRAPPLLADGRPLPRASTPATTAADRASAALFPCQRSALLLPRGPWPPALAPASPVALLRSTPR